MSSRRSRNLTDYCRAGLRHKLLLLTPVLVMAAAAGASLAKLPNLYKSTAIVGVANITGVREVDSGVVRRLPESGRELPEGVYDSARRGSSRLGSVIFANSCVRVPSSYAIWLLVD